MKFFWLYIESYTFIFRGSQGYLFFNSISNHSFLVSAKSKIYILIERLLDPNQMYCIEISEHEANKYNIWAFIKQLRDTYTGDLFNKDFVRDKPLGLPPKPSIMKSIERLNIHPENSIGQNLLNYLHQLNIYITGRCSLECKNCAIYSKQLLTCLRDIEEIDILLLKEFIFSANPTDLFRINFLGGDIFKYSKWEEFCLLIKDLPTEVRLYNHYKNILLNSEKVLNIPKGSTFCVIVNEDFSINELKKAIEILAKNYLNLELIFHISSHKQYSRAVSFLKEIPNNNYIILPIFNGTNKAFFVQNVYLNDESILSCPNTKKNIFSRMSINSNDFGKLNIMSNGDVYANPNFQKLGNIGKSSIYEILYLELSKNTSWLKIRNQTPCNECIYQWLCPSPSNYEVVIGKPNLCHIKA